GQPPGKTVSSHDRLPTLMLSSSRPMPSYRCEITGETSGVTTLTIGFDPGSPASNDLLVRDARDSIDHLNLPGGRGVRFNGPASLPVAMVLAHAVAHKYGWVACWDPKLARYV